MKNAISKVIVCFAVFILTLFVSSSIYNKGNEEMTANMTEASLPEAFFGIRLRRSATAERWALQLINMETALTKYPLRCAVLTGSGLWNAHPWRIMTRMRSRSMLL